MKNYIQSCADVVNHCVYAQESLSIAINSKRLYQFDESVFRLRQAMEEVENLKALIAKEITYIKKKKEFYEQFDQ